MNFSTRVLGSVLLAGAVLTLGPGPGPAQAVERVYVVAGVADSGGPKEFTFADVYVPPDGPRVTPDRPMEGGTVFIGDGCDPGSVPLPAAGVRIAVAEAGTCSEQVKVENAEGAGYDGTVIFGEAGSCERPEWAFAGYSGSSLAVGVPRVVALRILGLESPVCATPPPSTGTTGLDVAITAGFAPGRCANDVLGTGQRDVVTGLPVGERMLGRGGNDLLEGGGGRDCLLGGAGSDQLFGGGGADDLTGGGGKDYLFGDGGNDRLVGGAGNDVLVGGPGKDTIKCGKGRDIVIADRKDKVARDCEVVRR